MIRVFSPKVAKPCSTSYSFRNLSTVCMYGYKNSFLINPAAMTFDPAIAGVREAGERGRWCTSGFTRRCTCRTGATAAHGQNEYPNMRHVHSAHRAISTSRDASLTVFSIVSMSSSVPNNAWFWPGQWDEYSYEAGFGQNRDSVKRIHVYDVKERHASVQLLAFLRIRSDSINGAVEMYRGRTSRARPLL